MFGNNLSPVRVRYLSPGYQKEIFAKKFKINNLKNLKNIGGYKHRFQVSGNIYQLPDT